MSKTIRILYLEDNLIERNYYHNFLEQSLANVANLTFTYVTTPAEACDILKNHASDFDIFLTDLFFKSPVASRVNEEEYTAKIAVKEASNHKHLLIIALSHAAKDAHIDEEFKNEDGGHICIDKSEIKVKRIKRSDLYLYLRPKLLEHKLISAQTAGHHLDWVRRSDPRLDVIIDTIGTENLYALLHDIDPETDRFVPSYVAPGLSGAIVLRIDGYKAARSYPSSLLLVKCNRDIEQLQTELANVPSGQEPGSDIYVRYITNKVVSTDHGWNAIAAAFHDKAVTFGEWICRHDVTKPDIEYVLDYMFCGHLEKTYKLVDQTKENAGMLLAFDEATKVRILNQFDLLGSLIKSTLTKTTLDVHKLNQFVDLGLLRGVPLERIKIGSHLCKCHGDLHARNILIKLPTRNPSLIDPAYRGSKLWATDITQLSVDLWVNLFSSGPKSYQWDELSVWRDYISNWVAGAYAEDADIIPINKNILSTVEWIRDKQKELFGHTVAQPIDFHFALAVEFLKMTSYTDTPAPKRCLALLAANDLINTLEQEVQTLRC